MRRNRYGRDYKPPSHVARNLLVAIVATIVVVAFVWTTYDPQTLRLMSGVGAEAKKLQAPEAPRIDTKQQSATRNKAAPR